MVKVSWDYGSKGRPQCTIQPSKKKAKSLMNWIAQYGPWPPQNIKIEPLETGTKIEVLGITRQTS